MNNLKKLKTLIDEGKYLDEHKISRETEEIPTTSFNYHRKITVYDVDKEKYKEWDKNVINFLGSNHLSQFIEPKGLWNDFQEEHKGNIINFTPQYKKIQNLYKELIQIPEINEYFNAEFKFNIMLGDVNKTISEAVKDVM